MEGFVRGCVWVVKLAIKAYILLICIYFGSFAFHGFWGGYQFNPELLPLTALCAVFAYLMVAPRRWMPARWLQDVSFRRAWCVGLACAPMLFFVVLDMWREEVSLLRCLWILMEVLPFGAIPGGLLALRWWANEPSLRLITKVRFILGAILLWLLFAVTMTLEKDQDLPWFVYALLILVTVGFVATFRITRKQPPREGDSKSA
ncbi:MAG: hypothetical protein RLZZ405_577 [Verrucomicrobiota bacterium]|jgi:hypothetical protein